MSNPGATGSQMFGNLSLGPVKQRVEDANSLMATALGGFLRFRPSTTHATNPELS